MTRRSISIVAWAYAGFVVAFIGWAAFAALRDHVQVPTTDDSRILVGMLRMPFWDWVFSAQNGHRVPGTLLLFAADFRWLGAKNNGLVVASLATLGLALAMLGAGIRTGGGFRPPVVRLVFAGACFGLFWVASVFNLLRGICHANTAVLLFGFLALTALVRHAAKGGRGALVLCLVAATLSTLSMGQGIAIWPALLVVAITLRLPFRTLGWIGLATLVVGGLVGWSVAGFTAQFSTLSPGEVLLRHPLGLVRFATTLMGGVVGVILREVGLTESHIGSQNAVCGIVGWLVFVGHIRWVRRNPARAGSLDGLAVGVMALGIAVAFGIGVTRLFAFGPDVAQAARFFDWSGLFWVGALLSAGAFAARSPRPEPSFAACASALVAVTGILIAALPALRAEELRRLERSRDSSLAILLGVAGPFEFYRFYRGPRAELVPLFERLRSEKKSLYADRRIDWIGRSFDQVFSLEPESRCEGGISPTVSGTEDHRGEWRAAGWAWDVQRAGPPESIVLVNSRGRIGGLANLQRPLGYPSAGRADWQGWVRLHRRGNRYTAYGVVDDGSRACLVAPVPRRGAGT